VNRFLLCSSITPDGEHWKKAQRLATTTKRPLTNGPV